MLLAIAVHTPGDHCDWQYLATPPDSGGVRTESVRFCAHPGGVRRIRRKSAADCHSALSARTFESAAESARTPRGLRRIRAVPPAIRRTPLGQRRNPPESAADLVAEFTADSAADSGGLRLSPRRT